MTQTSPATRLLDGLRVLVVEDEAIVSFLLEDMLSALGALDVRHAGTLASALAALDAGLPDLAVLDVNLGGERVYPVAERLDAACVKFVFTTGYGRKGIEPRWAAKSVVQKPFSVETMAAALRAVLQG
ncbi:MAG TPA: response regulator [Rhizomicrobium sp.]|jgi:CheY-like chemotaxis protein|nr:response regulator [Rhizomicrobium sp.]